MSDRVALALALILAPWPLLGLAVLLRGYDVSLSLRRRRRPEDGS